MDYTGIQYRSNFARELQQGETMPNYYTQQPASNYKSHTEKQNTSQKPLAIVSKIKWTRIATLR